MRRPSSIEIERIAAATDDVRTLIAELDRELSAHYDETERHGLSVEAVFQPHIRFFIARRDGEPAGCGGVALFDDFAEVKRMYVRPPARGSGVADAILTQLEATTSAHGLTTLRLETGIHQFAAIRFYERRGFVPCAAFGAYLSMPADCVATSVFLEKRIATV